MATIKNPSIRDRNPPSVVKPGQSWIVEYKEKSFSFTIQKIDPLFEEFSIAAYEL